MFTYMPLRETVGSLLIMEMSPFYVNMGCGQAFIVPGVFAD
jgi:hypothetical protein